VGSVIHCSVVHPKIAIAWECRILISICVVEDSDAQYVLFIRQKLNIVDREIVYCSSVHVATTARSPETLKCGRAPIDCSIECDSVCHDSKEGDSNP
jgi:hypothetical protein